MLRIPTRRQALGHCVVTAATVAVCLALLTTALLLHAPLVIAPLLALVCIGCPLALTWSLPTSIAVLRIDTAAVRALRRQLARLPETPHPHGY